MKYYTTKEVMEMDGAFVGTLSANAKLIPPASGPDRTIIEATITPSKQDPRLIFITVLTYSDKSVTTFPILRKDTEKRLMLMGKYVKLEWSPANQQIL